MKILTSLKPSVGHRAYPKALFMVLPENFRLSAQSALDNFYMSDGGTKPNAALARTQSLGLLQKLSEHGHTVLAFAGHTACPDGVFPNNVFATREHVGGEASVYITGKMRHPERQAETQRKDLHTVFANLLGMQQIELGCQLEPHDYAELTGSLVIDRSRNIGFCGLSERCSLAGAKAMHEAFGLNKTYVFPLAKGEYHTNVVLSALGGKGLVIVPSGFQEPKDAETLMALYPQACIEVSAAQKTDYAANCIALAADQLWMSARAANALRPEQEAMLTAMGFMIHSCELSELERAGGSLRCMLGEIY